MIDPADLDRITSLLWCPHTQVWAARARGSNDFFEASTAAEAIRLALNPPEEDLW